MSTDPTPGTQPSGDNVASGGWLPPSGAPFPQQPEPAPPAYGAYGQPTPGTQPQVGGPGVAGPWRQPPSAAPQPQAMGFSVAPKPGIIPLRPLGVGDILDGSFQALRVNPRAMFVPSLVVTAGVGAVSAAVTYIAYSQIAPLFNDLDIDAGATLSLASYLSLNLGTLTSSLLLLLASAILTGLLIVAVSRSVLGRVAELDETWERTKRRIPALLAQTLLLSLVTSLMIIMVFLVAALTFLSLNPDLERLGEEATPQSVLLPILTFVLLFIGAVVVSLFLQIRLLVAPAALVLENVGVIESFKRSWQLTRGSFWRTLGTFMLVTMLAGTVSSILGGLVGTVQGLSVALSEDVSVWLNVASSFLVPLVSGLVLPFQAAAYALMYIDLRIRKEGLDVELRKASE